MLIKCGICEKEFKKGRRTKFCSMACGDEAKRRRNVVYKLCHGQSNTPAWLKLRFKILVRDDFTCQYCGRGVPEGVILQLDHIIPLSKGGIGEEENLITACQECNSGKSDVLLDLRLINKLKAEQM